MAGNDDPFVVERATLDNGIELVRQPPPAGSHSASFTFLAPAGWAYDPPGSAGLAVLVGTVLPSGAGRRDRVALARELDRLGASLSTDVSAESAEATIWGPASAVEQMLPLLADAALRPRFDAKDVARVRRQIYERQLRQESQPESRAERILLASLFPPGHPYRSAEGLGTRASVRSPGAEDISRFHRSQYVTRSAILAATTALPLARLVKRLGALFGGASAPAPAPSLPPLTRPPEAGIHRASMPGRSQVEIRIGGRSIARSDPRYAAAYLANEVLGGRPLLSRLFQRVREHHGLAYHASSSLEAMTWGGYFVAQAGTGPKVADRARRLVLAELRRLSEESIGSTELDRMRESAIGSLPLAVETTSGAHEVALDVAYHHLPSDHYRKWPATLRAVSPRDLREAAQAAMDGTQVVTVLAGPLGKH